MVQGQARPNLSENLGLSHHVFLLLAVQVMQRGSGDNEYYGE